jgi:hypothetical protein
LGQMFIDPNCSVFAQFNGQRPTYIPTAEDDKAGNGLDLGNPVYTRGNITTVEGSVVVSSQAGATGSVLVGPSASTGGFNNVIAVNITAQQNNQIITSGAVTAATSLYAGQNFYLQDTRIVGQASMGGGVVGGGFKRLTVNTGAVTPSSRIFLTNASQNNAGSVYSVENIVAGVSFQIVSNNTLDGSAINWLVIN